MSNSLVWYWSPFWIWFILFHLPHVSGLPCIVFQLCSSSHSLYSISFLRPVHFLFLLLKSSSNSFSPFSWLTLLVLTWLPRTEVDIPLLSFTLLKNLLIVSSSAWHLPSTCLSPQHDHKPHRSRDCLMVFIPIIWFVSWNVEGGSINNFLKTRNYKGWVFRIHICN